MRRIFAGVVVAAAALTTLSLAGPGVMNASASTQAAAAKIGNTYTRGEAGYMMTGGGWRFRYLATTLTVPAAGTGATTTRLSLWDDADALYLWVKAGGGPGSILSGWSYDEQGTPLAVAPNVGDQVTVSIYYDRKVLRAYVTAVDSTQGTRATSAMSTKRNFAWAQVSGDGPRSLASSKTRLWAFRNTRVTSFNGTHGTIFGPWGTYRVVSTTTGRATAPVVLWPGYPWNNGHNFGIWWRS